MPTQRQKADVLRALHVSGDPVVLYNVWDPGSARVVADAGTRALATGSAPVAMSQGYPDGEQIPLEDALANVERIVRQTDLPVSFDFEGGYAARPDKLRQNTHRALSTGIVGLNFEDQVVGTADLHALDVQVERIAAVRRAVDETQTGAFLNCRTDLFLKSPRDEHDEQMLEAAVARARAYADAGADGFFAPGLLDESLIEALCASVPLPVNILALPDCPPTARLAALGVARISYGPVAYKRLMAQLNEAASEALGAPSLQRAS